MSCLKKNCRLPLNSISQAIHDVQFRDFYVFIYRNSKQYVFGVRNKSNRQNISENAHSFSCTYVLCQQQKHVLVYKAIQYSDIIVKCFTNKSHT